MEDNIRNVLGLTPERVCELIIEKVMGLELIDHNAETGLFYSNAGTQEKAPRTKKDKVCISDTKKEDDDANAP